MAITFVTSQRTASGGAGSLTTSALSATTTDLIVAWVYWEDTTKTATVTDTGGHTWTAKTQVTNGANNRGQLWYAYGSAITGATPTVTATLSSGTALMSLEVLQIAGTATAADPFDVEDTSTGAGAGGALTSNAFTTTVADEIIVQGAFVISAGSCDTVGPIGGVNGTLASCTAQYRIVSATQTSITATLNNNNFAFVSSVATFKIASGGAAFLARPPVVVKQAVNRASTY